MGKLYECTSHVAISSNEEVYLVNKKNREITVLEVPHVETNSSEIKKQEINQGEEIICLVASKDGQYLAVATQSKRLLLWCVSSWSFMKEVSLVKRPMSIAFLPDSSKLIVADKNGDVYGFNTNEDFSQKKPPDSDQESITDTEPGPEPLLGHLSMLLDLAITEDGKFLITCDRDEKIRVSCYPNCYNIHTFCLGHTEFVSQIKLVPNQRDLLLSSSGDGQVKLWNFVRGECLATLDVKPQIEAFFGHYFKGSEDTPEEVKLKPHSTFISKLQIWGCDYQKYVLVISFYRIPMLLFYEINNSNNFRLLHSYETDSIPLDFLFLESGDILAYLETAESQVPNPLVVLRPMNDFSGVHKVEDHPITQFGKECSEKLKGKDVWSLDANALYKHRYDNVADYQKKKQERLNADKLVLPQKRKAPL